ncbi:Transcriptional regulatory protein DegU [Rosistilla ulvae]|uniref:Transcriptional regulatory protein DegU n=1 Tax=Rosistilla ulvae TaxID=1930277 RepID=A0A517LZI4_9BACT|nr:response regulator transcription factor [Rosistilla ulvae]QDS88026.1 Transcriptional regulatory protein DegU [Rosistilla ulvae]
MKRTRVLLADDHRIVAEGLRNILEPAFTLVAIVEDGRELIEVALREQPDVIVADITMPLLNGLDAIDAIRSAGCQAKVVFLTMHRDATYAARALRSGASGFVLKHSAAEELLTAIRCAIAGETFVTQSIAESIEQMPASRRANKQMEQPLLTPRQREVLQLFAEGHTAPQVAKVLQISKRTAENHKARIMCALGVSSTSDLVQYAIRHGLIAGK